MHHHHPHGPHGEHSHAPPGGSSTGDKRRGAATRAYIAGIGLNLAFVVVEAGFGIYAHSLALIADASHNFGDVISLVLSAVAMLLARRLPSARFTYGMGASTILAALMNALLLLVITGGIVWAAISRIQSPAPLNTGIVMVVALIGVLINGLTAVFFLKDQHHDLNARGAFLHMVADTAVSVGVIVGALLIRATGRNWIDSAVSLVIAAVILFSTVDLLWKSLRLSMHAVPVDIDPDEVRRFLLQQSGVQEAHDLHIWAMSTTETALTAHLVMPGGHPGDDFLADLCQQLDERFHVDHTTLQVEIGGAGPCRLAAGHV